MCTLLNVTLWTNLRLVKIMMQPILPTRCHIIGVVCSLQVVEEASRHADTAEKSKLRSYLLTLSLEHQLLLFISKSAALRALMGDSLIKPQEDEPMDIKPESLLGESHSMPE